MTIAVPVARSGQLTTLDQLAAIPEEEIWLAKQKSRQTRRAYKLDVRHFMRALGIADTDQLRQVDHRAVIAWERMQPEQREIGLRHEIDGLLPLRRRDVRHRQRGGGAD